MKKIFLLFFILFSFKSFSQGKRVYGTYTVKNESGEEQIVDDFTGEPIIFQVYVVKSTSPKSKNELIFQSKKGNNNFDFIVSEKQLKKYPYLEFPGVLIRIDTIKNNSLNIVYERKPVLLMKPVIYLYPTEKKQYSIKLDLRGKLLTTYPVYDSCWTVIADTNGVLFNLNDKRSYNYLFWDAISTFPKEHYDYKNGFYVERKNYINFLQRKLSYIGLKESEVNEFIVYWLPLMNKHEKCFIHFWINDNIDQTAFIETTPKTDSQIRVYMEFAGYSGSEKNENLSEQTLPQLKRNGSILVEWGGSEIEKERFKFINP